MDDVSFPFAVRFVETPSEDQRRSLGHAFARAFDETDPVQAGAWLWNGERHAAFTVFVRESAAESGDLGGCISASSRFVGRIHRIAPIDEAVFHGAADCTSEQHEWSVSQQPTPDPRHIPADADESEMRDAIFEESFDSAASELDELDN